MRTHISGRARAARAAEEARLAGQAACSARFVADCVRVALLRIDPRDLGGAAHALAASVRSVAAVAVSAAARSAKAAARAGARGAAHRSARFARDSADEAAVNAARALSCADDVAEMVGAPMAAKGKK